MALLAPIEISNTSSTQQMSVGQRYRDPRGEGRTFYYSLAGGTTLARGKINVAATIAGNHVNLNFQTAPAIGDTDVSVTLGGTLTTADMYKDGWLVVQDGTGEGRAYHIEGHPAADASATQTLTLSEQIDTAGALSEANVDLIKNKYDSVVVSVADQADPVVGVNLVSITNAEYGWQQTWGACSVLQDETVAVGSMVVVGESVVGAIQVDDGAAEPAVGQIGPQAGVDTEYQLAYLKIDP
jgi:hypothetical protein